MGGLIIDFVLSQFIISELELTPKQNGREEVDFLIGDNQLYLQSINLDTTQRSIKISKQDLGELKDNLFIVLVLILDKEPKSYLHNSIEAFIAIRSQCLYRK